MIWIRKIQDVDFDKDFDKVKIYRYILLAIGALAVGLMSEGCSSRSSDEPRPDQGEFCELVISLSSETSVTETPATRADRPWDNDPDPESGFPSEYRIDRVLLYFVTPGNAIIPFSPTLTDRDDVNNTVTYRTEIDVRSPFVSHYADGTMSLSGRIVAVANGPEDYIPADPFSRIPFDISDVDSRGLIPMWGVTTVSGLPLIADGTTHAGEIKLLRAVPKITIEMADDLKDLYTITQVVPDQRDYLTQGYIAPGDAADATRTGSLMMEGCFNPFLGAAANTSPQFYNIGKYEVWGYLTERQGPASATPLSFTVTLAEKAHPERNFTGKVYLCDYLDNGQPDFSTAFTRLVRNHDYRYRISLRELEFVISFKEWIFGGKVHIELE